MQYIIRISAEGIVRPIPFEDGEIVLSELEQYIGTAEPVILPCGITAHGLIALAAAGDSVGKVNVVASLLRYKFGKVYGNACLLSSRGDGIYGFDFETTRILRKYIIETAVKALKAGAKE